jgi:hypothetical protein
MKNNVAGIRVLMQNTFFVITALVFFNPVHAQVSGYTLTTSVGTFTPINSGSGTNFQTYVIGSSGFDELSVDYSLTPVPVGGTTTDYITVFDNGFIELVPTGFTPAYGSVSNPVSGDLTGPFTIAPFGTDLEAAETGSPALKIVTTGSEIIAEWDDVRRKGVSGEKISFQARINITTGEIKFIYGGTIVAGTDTNYPEVGLKGYSNRDFNNISVASTGSWSTPVPGATCRSTAYFNAANSGVAPVAGLTYTFTPTAVPDIIVARRDDNRLGLILNNEGATISDLHTSVSGNNLIITAAGTGNSIALAASVPSGVTTNGTSTITVDLSVMSDFGGFSVFGGINEDTVSIGTGGIDLSATPAGSARQSFTVELIDGPDQYFQDNPVISKNGGYIGIYCSCSYNIGGLTGAGADTLVLFTGGLVTQSAPVKAGLLSLGGTSDGTFLYALFSSMKPGKTNRIAPHVMSNRTPSMLGYNLDNVLNEVDSLTTGPVAELIFLVEKDSVTLLESAALTQSEFLSIVGSSTPPTLQASYNIQAGANINVKGVILGGEINLTSQNGSITMNPAQALLFAFGNVNLTAFTRIDAAFVVSFGNINFLSEGDVTVLPTGQVLLVFNIVSEGNILIDAGGDVEVNEGGLISVGNITIQADGEVLTDGNGVDNSNGTGNIAITSGSTVMTKAAGLKSQGNITVQAVGDVVAQDGGIVNSLGTGYISLSSNGSVTTSGGGLQSTGNITIQATGSVYTNSGGVTNSLGMGNINIVSIMGTVTAEGGGLQSKGDIVVQASGDIITKDAGVVNSSGTGNISITTTGGGITTQGSGLQSAGEISLAAMGNILMTNGGASNVSGAGNITVVTTGGTFTSNQNGLSSTGDISVSASGDILITDGGMNNTAGAGNIIITSSGGVTISSNGLQSKGNIAIQADGDIVTGSAGVINISGTGNITITTTGGRITTQGNGLQSKGDISLVATGDILITNSGASNITGTGNITVVTTGGTFTSNQNGISSAGEISVNASGNIQITDGGVYNTAGSGNIMLTSAGGVSVGGSGLQSKGDITVQAGGAIITDAGGVINTSGTGNISMTTTGGGITTKSSGLRSKGDISLSATGDILITDGGVSNSTGTGNITVVTTGGTFTSSQTGVSSAGEISVTASGNIQVTDGGVNNTAGSGNIMLTSAGGVSVGGSGLQSKGDITVQAGGAIITDAGGVINTSGTGNISMTTTGGGITTMSSGLQSKGDISLSAIGDVLITNGGASNSSGTGNITVITTGGTFTSNQNGISSAGEISVTASGNILVADAGINSTSATDDVFITSTAGGITLQGPVSSGSDVILAADIFTNSLMGGSVTGDIIRIKPHNFTNIELGSADATGLLGLSADDLQNINADTIHIGDSALTQDITVTSLLNLSGKNLAFKTAQGGKLSMTNSLTVGFIDLSGVSEFSTEVLDNSTAYFIDAATGAELGAGVSLTIADIPDDLQIGDVISLISSSGQVSGNFSGLNAGDTIRIVDARAATIEFVIDYGSAGRGNPDASRIIPATGVTLTVADVVFESVPPVAVCKDTTVVLDASGSISLSASVLDDGSYDLLSPPVSFLPLNTQFSCSDLGANTVTLTVTDTIGNTATCQSVITVNTATSPAVSITETSSGINNDGIICAGSSATIAVTGSSACLWSDGSTGTSISVSPSCTSIYSVTITDGSSCTSDVDNLIEVSKSPGITSVTPVSGTAGTVITINGTDLTGVVSVLFNGTPSATVNEISSGQITATLPQSGSIQQLTVNTNCGMVSIPVASPVITSFSPSAGSIGTPITVTGSNLNNLQTAQVGGTAAVILSRSSSAAVIVPMPGTSTGTIMVSNGTGTTTSSGTFTVNATPYPYFQQGSKLSSTGTNTLQGTSVAVSANGNTAIIGAPGDNSGAGAAYIYVRTGTSWAQQGAKLVGSGAVGSSRQGTSVAISSDGNTVVVGGPNDNSNAGAAWIYTRNGSSWSQQGPKLVGTGAAGAALQGTSVALSGDGATVVVGGFGDDSFAGAVWVFSRADNYWLQQGNKIVGTGTVGKARQGASVALSSDGNTLIFGGYQDNNRQGAAWVFSRAGCDWTQQGSKLLGSGGSNQAWQGVSVALGADGNYAVIGGSSDNNLVGAAWVFTRSGNTWTQQGSKIAGTAPVGASRQGSSVAISADGKTAVIGGAGDNGGKGAMWMFTRSNTTWSQQGQKLTGSTAAGAAKQATSVALSADGKTALIGGPADASNKGAFWVYIPAAGALFRPDVRSEMPDMAGEFKLEQNIPNPFKGQTTVPFVLPEPSTVAWEISDASGRVVLSLKRDYPTGENQEVFNLEMYNGAFYYRMTTPHGTKVRKMTALGN